MKAHEIVSEVLKRMAATARPGVTGLMLEDVAIKVINECGGHSYNKGYFPSWATKPYPAATCININHFIAHGVPSNYKFRDGDIVNIDLSVVDPDGICGDAALTVPIGDLNKRTERLLRVAANTTYEVIRHIKNGVLTDDLARITQRFVWNHNLLVNRRFTGHGIGVKMHEFPKIYSTIEDGQVYETLKTGDILCIEPILTTGTDDIGVTLDDGWTVITRDRMPSAMFEHMVRVTDDGCEVLTTHFSLDAI